MWYSRKMSINSWWLYFIKPLEGNAVVYDELMMSRDAQRLLNSDWFKTWYRMASLLFTWLTVYQKLPIARWRIPRFDVEIDLTTNTVTLGSLETEIFIQYIRYQIHSNEIPPRRPKNVRYISIRLSEIPCSTVFSVGFVVYNMGSEMEHQGDCFTAVDMNSALLSGALSQIVSKTKSTS